MPSSDLDKHELYLIIRRAIRDAIWDVIEKILTVFVAIIVIFVGGGFAAQGFQSSSDPRGWLAVVFGLVLMAAGVVYFLREFDLLPFT